MITHIKRRSNKGRVLWSIAFLVALVGVGVYFFLHPESLPEWAKRTSIGRDLQTTTIYKWQDASGRWHVSDQPPPAGTKYETEGYARDTNVLPLPPELQQ